MNAPSDLDEFSTPIGLGGRRVPVVEFDAATKADLLARLDTFDAARNRGAVEVRSR